jgi:hypothetical protein
VNSRIVVDRATFRRLNPNYYVPVPVPPKLEVEEIAPPPSGGRFNPYDSALPMPPMQFDNYGNPISIPLSNGNVYCSFNRKVEGYTRFNFFRKPDSNYFKR